MESVNKIRSALGITRLRRSSLTRAGTARTSREFERMTDAITSGTKG